MFFLTPDFENQSAPASRAPIVQLSWTDLSSLELDRLLVSQNSGKTTFPAMIAGLRPQEATCCIIAGCSGK